MADEREAIFDWLQTVIADVDDVAFVSRNARQLLIGQVSEFPGVFLLDLGDTEAEAETPQRGINEWLLNVGIVLAYKGTSNDSTEESAPGEAAALLRKIRKQVYDTISDGNVGQVVDSFRDKGKSHLSFPPLGPKTAVQATLCEFRYLEDKTFPD